MRFLLPSALVATALFTAEAQAKQLDACGDFFFVDSGTISCEVEVEGGCTAACEPVAFQTQCAADLTVTCGGECEFEADVDCTASCEGSCVTECEAGNFDCEASCSGNCRADCAGRCEGAADGAQCEASCEASCDAECEVGCEGTGPSCESQCEGSCSGECTAEANAECQIDCQTSGWAGCESKLQGGCEAQCEEPSGALFCNEQFVDTDDLDACVAAIQATFEITVTGYIEGECSGNECNVKAGCSTSCATAPATTTSSDFSIGMLAVGLAGFLGAAGRRLTRKKR